MPFSQVRTADLILDRVYAGGTGSSIAGDPLAAMLPVGNQGGFRYKGSVKDQSVRLIVLFSTGSDLDWPDAIDPETGDFTYYGDNKSPGSDLHATRRNGNLLLRDIFAWSRLSPADRLRVPPILLFEKAGSGRDVRFRGLLAPGSPRLAAEEELVAVWRTSNGMRFQNYRSHFTMLKEGCVSRAWIDEILSGDPTGDACPPVWRRWVNGRIYDALEAPRNLQVRSKEAQYPPASKMPLLRLIHQYFSPSPTAFEHFAADIWLRHDSNVEEIDVTKPSRDGGRDAVGKYRIGPASDPVRISFALEAKCFAPGSGIGVRMVSRLISRLKHRDFGVFVTTSHVGAQPYQEVREDGHPVVFLTGRDIIEVLDRIDVRTVDELASYLEERYPLDGPSTSDLRTDVRFIAGSDPVVEGSDAARADGAPALDSRA